MAFKTILTAITDPGLVPGMLSQVTGFAARHDAHLDALAFGVDQTQTGYYTSGTAALVMQDSLGRARDEALAVASALRAGLESSGLRWSLEEAVAPLAGLGRAMGARARFADLVILPMPYAEGRDSTLALVLEGALFEGQAPVLVLPEAGEMVENPKRIVIGWNESVEALNAVRAALPLLRAAETVQVVIIDPPAHGPNRSDPGGLLGQWLARHGVRAEISVLARTLPRVCDVMMRQMDEMGADLLVMGAYGHSRMREAILGGATRAMLSQPFVPVFMAH